MRVVLVMRTRVCVRTRVRRQMMNPCFLIFLDLCLMLFEIRASMPTAGFVLPNPAFPFIPSQLQVYFYVRYLSGVCNKFCLCIYLCNTRLGISGQEICSW